MNAELLQKVAASVDGCTGIDCNECRDAVLRVAIEACAARIDSHRKEMHRREREERQMDGQHYEYYLARRHEAEYLIAQIRALLTDAEATDAQSDAS